MRVLLFSAAVMMALAQPSVAADECASLIGTKITFDDPEQVVTALKTNSLVKGEFETSDQYEARVGPLKDKLDGIMTLPVELSRDYVAYDADSQIFSVGAWSFPSGVGFFSTTLWKDRKGVKLGILDRVAVTLSENSKTVGSYEASNAFGVSAVVSEVDKTIIAAFERASSYTRDEDLFGADDRRTRHVLPDSTLTNGKGGRPIMRFSIPIADARSTKEALVGGVMFQPRAPFMIEGEKHYDATIQNKRQLSEYVSLLIGDFKCGFVSRPDGMVLAAEKTN